MDPETYQSMLLDTISAAVIGTDEGLVIQYWNKAAEKLFGMTAEQAIGRLMKDVIRTDRSPADRERIRKLVYERGEYSFYGIALHPDGRQMELLTSAVAMRHPDGSVQGYAITSRAVQRIESLYRIMAANLPNGAAFIVDHDLRYLLAEGQALRLVGMTPDDFEGKTIWEAPGGSAIELFETYYRRALRGEFCQVDHHTEGRDYSTHLSPVYDEQGSVAAALALSYDITERKQAEIVVQNAYAHLRFLIDSNIIGVLSVKEDGTVIEANDYYLNMIGYTRADFDAGLVNWRSITPPEYLYLDERAIQEMHERGTCTPYEKEYIRKDGQRMWVFLSDVRLQDGTIAAFALDLTESKNAQALLEEYADRLKRSNQDLEQFAFSASHDLQEPLRKIRMFGEIAKPKLQDAEPETLDIFNRMMNASQRMEGMIEDLLALSRVNTKGRPFEMVDLAAVAAEVVSDLEGRIIRTGGEVLVEALPVIEADPIQMHQVLQNLISNGLKFHRPELPPLVRVRSALFQDEGKCEMVAIRVEDNGIGFELSQFERILQPFQRLHGRNEYEGSGIGLAIVKKIVERHGGQIRAQSSPGHGTAFTILLPVKHT